MIPEGWMEVRLGDLGSTFGGLTGKSAKDFGNGDSSFVTFMNVMSNVVLREDGTERVDVKAGEAQAQLRPGDLIFNGSSETPEEVGFAAVVPRELDGVYLNSFCFGFRCNPDVELDPKFFAYLTRSPVGRGVIRPMAQGSTRYNLAKTNLLNGRFLLPSKREQRVIAEALSDVDVMTESLDALIAKKRDMKQAAMQQLLTGRTRIPGFTSEWETTSVGALATIAKGIQLGRAEMNPDDRVPVWNGGVEPSGFTATPNIDRPVVTVSEGGNSCGWIGRQAGDFWLGGHCYALEPRDSKKSIGFLYHTLKAAEPRIMALRVGSGLPNIQKKSLAEFQLLVPTDESEASLLARIFDDIDSEIDALVARREKADLVKQGMMQELLSGRVRLV